MTFERITRRIDADAPGTSAELAVFRAGPGDAARKIYLQAALHADEQPGIMVLHHLLAMLEDADTRGELQARFTIVPMANPLGMGQILHQNHFGRYDLRSGTNFNRNWPDLFAAVHDTVGPRLTADGKANVTLIRAAVRDWLASQTPATALHKLRHAIMGEAYDADYVLDLHCDNEALPHLFVTPESMDHLTELADWMESAAQLTAADSGGGSFDEVWPSLWTRLAQAHPDKPIPFSAVAATLEYRGRPDVHDRLGKEDAEKLFGFFQAKGFVAGTPAHTPPKAPAPLPLAATEMVRVERASLIAYRVELGEIVEKGQPIADLIALDGPDAFTARTPIHAGTSGRVISRLISKYALPGASIAKIAGSEPLPDRAGYLLED